MKIAHFGAFDVENYGDLLLPLVLERRLSGVCREFVHVSPVGGPPVWGDCVRSVAAGELMRGASDVGGVVVGGGRIVRASPSTVEPYDDSSGGASSSLAYPSLWLDAAYTAARDDLPLCWNGPGVPEAFGPVAARLARWAASVSDYVSVGDGHSRHLLEEAGVSQRIDVVPNTVMEVSRLWTEDEISEAYANAFVQRNRSVPERSLVFHLNSRYVGGSHDEAAARVDRICKKLDATAVLIATAPCYGDDGLQRRIAQKMSTGPLLIDRPQSLREVAACIALSKAYLGSSLGGMITACSFGRRGMVVASEEVPESGEFTGFLERFHLTSWLSESWAEAEQRIDELFAAPADLWERTLEVASPELDRHWTRVRAALLTPQRGEEVVPQSNDAPRSADKRLAIERLRGVVGDDCPGEGPVFQELFAENPGKSAAALKDKEREVSGLKRQLGELEAERREEIEDLRDELRARAAEETNAMQRLAATRKQLSAAERERNRRSREVERLARWVEELGLASSALLNSRRWKIGGALGEVWRRVSLRPRAPTAQDQLDNVMKRFRAWRESLEDAETSALPNKRAESQSSAVEPAKSQKPAQNDEKSTVEPTTNTASIESLAPAAFDSWHSGSAEQVLDKLRDLPPVSIVIPIYNAYEDLQKCLKSVVRNTTTPAELLLINDASTDSRIPSLLAEYEALENVRVLTNDENLGFVRTVNRGFSESSGDAVLLNSDVEVTPRWLENLTLAAYTNPQTATVTAISNNAGAFSAPKIGEENKVPEGLGTEEVARLITQQSGQIYPQAPTGNGFCMYIKRAVLDEIGLFDAENFPRGYGEENDFCMRAQKRGWNHMVDDSTFIFHRRSASFGSEKKEFLAAGLEAIDRLHPEYAQLARVFVESEDMKRVGVNVQAAYERVGSSQDQVKPRVLFVIHHLGGGTPYTNSDLMHILADRYSPYLLVSDALRLKLFRHTPNGPLLLEEWSLRGKWQATEFSRPDYRAIVFSLLVKYRFELVHIRHLIGHTFDLPEVAARLRIPVVLSFHDFYFSCPTTHLIDDHGEHCGGICTPGYGQCTLPVALLQELPLLKHAWLNTWRQQVEHMFGYVDAFVTTSLAAKEIYLRSLPSLRNRPFEVIEHGRDLEQGYLATPPGEDRIRILIPGTISPNKGAHFIRRLKQVDVEERLKLHFLGEGAAKFRDLGLDHGPYEREEFNSRVKEIKPSFIGIFSIWPETYCHTLTEAWAAGVPVLASDIGTLRERVNAHGGGWLIDYKNPQRAYEQIIGIASDRASYVRELERANLHGIRSTKEMSDDYETLYEAVLRERRAFTPSATVREDGAALSG